MAQAKNELDNYDNLGLCLNEAKEAFIERARDTNRLIVQMKLHGELIPHWYFRSDQWVHQPFFNLRIFLQPYTGPVSDATPALYGAGTYVIDQETTEFVTKLVTSKGAR